MRAVARPRKRTSRPRRSRAAQSPAGVEPLRTILVATDLSENAMLALDWACAIAREQAARIHVVHALSPPRSPLSAPELVALPAAEHGELRRALRRRLEETRVALRGRGLRVDVELRVGPPAPTLLDAIAQCTPDLVVAGTRGLTGFRHRVLGSTAARLVRDSPVPLFSVHPRDASRTERIRTVLVPTDFSDDAGRAADMALRLLAPAARSRLILCHACHLPAEFSALGSAPVARRLDEARDAARRRLEQIAVGLEAPGREITCEAVTGHPADAIEALARRHDVDLVAMGTRGLSGAQRLLFGSTAERVLPRAPCPVLTVPPSEC